ncbi:MAG: hypothetical protein JSV99_04730 [Planctomycetota bacterium]|nr:MAG: hypothetical protein JSV99_04730 [Planctomycetota bacterium]
MKKKVGPANDMRGSSLRFEREHKQVVRQRKISWARKSTEGGRKICKVLAICGEIVGQKALLRTL